ncbi:MAG: S-layer homology domain-containing protein [Oscillospiraceae bacterium]
MKKRFLPILFSLALCISLFAVGGGSAEAFYDISDNDVSEAAEVLSGLGILTGYTDGSYKPNEGLTRAEFCALAIRASEYSDQVRSSAYRTLYTDLTASHWAAPYVNLAQDEGLINGYGDGTFGPDDPVTVAQAVTVALRLLGYTSDNVGTLWPQDYMQMGDDLGLTDGIDSDADSTLTRGQAALLFYHLLGEETESGDDYISSLADGTISDAVVLDNDDEANDGTTGLLLAYTASGGISTYEQETQISDAMINRRGTLLLDSDGLVEGFVPDDEAWHTISLGDVTAAKITSSGSVSYAVPSGAVMVIDDDVTTYEDGWYDLDGRDSVTIFYSSAGNINLVVASDSQEYEGVMLTGYYESVTPNASNPSTMTMMGAELDVDSSAVSSLSQFDVGDRITVTLNGSGEVVSATSPSTKTAAMVGIVKSVSGKVATVTLFSGITVSGTISGSTDDLTGQLVRVTSSGVGKLSLSTSVSSSVSGTLSVTSEKLGSVPLADNVTIYDRVGNGIPVEVDLDDIQTSTVSSSEILYAATNSDGEVNLLVLNDVTGNAYTYGILYTGTMSTTTGGLTATNRTVCVENYDGTTDDYIVTSSTIKDETIGGISVKSDGKVAGVATLESESSVSRSSFDGTDTVTIDGVDVPISDDVQVYNSENENWITLSAAKAYTDTFTVYYSGEIGEDAVVRIVVIE